MSQANVRSSMSVFSRRLDFYNDVQDTVTTTAPDVPALPMASHREAVSSPMSPRAARVGVHYMTVT